MPINTVITTNATITIAKTLTPSIICGSPLAMRAAARIGNASAQSNLAPKDFGR
jgi:hypothetical protein